MKRFCKEYGLNAIYAGKHWSKRSGDKEFWRLTVLDALRKQRIPKQVFDGPVRILFYWNDGMDIDNHAYLGKMIVDSLKGYLIQDDTRRFYGECVHKFWEQDFIGVEVLEMEV